MLSIFRRPSVRPSDRNVAALHYDGHLSHRQQREISGRSANGDDDYGGQSKRSSRSVGWMESSDEMILRANEGFTDLTQGGGQERKKFNDRGTT